MSSRSRIVALVSVVLLVATSITGAFAHMPERTESSSLTAAAKASETRTLAISIDALNPRALIKLGRGGAPHFWRLIDEGATTLNARTQRELTLTLPNHTSMVTGRRISASKGGHGVTWNTDRPGTTVQKAAGHGVSSAFTVVHAAGGTTAVFSTKTKFSLFDRSWDAGIDRSTILEERDLALVKAARADLIKNDRAFTFLHLGIVDQTGHANGFMSPAYFEAVKTADALLGKILAAIDNHEALRDNLVVVLTADHGGQGKNHSDQTKLGNYRVPFMVWGPGVAHGDLYKMNPTYANPGTTRTDLTGIQPIRNGDVANLVTDLLGLAAVPGSIFDAKQRLSVSH